MRRSVFDRFWDQVDKDGPVPAKRPELGPCWLWTGKTVGGYGRFAITATRQPMAHRYAFELANGPIPPGIEPHHKCVTPLCVRDSHLDGITHRENCLQQDRTGTETHCVNGHEFTPENIYMEPNGGRKCRECRRDALRRHNATHPGRNRKYRKQKEHAS